MLDIAFIRENKEVVKSACTRKGLKADIEGLLKSDEARRSVLADIEKVRHERNQLTQAAKGKKPTAVNISRGKQLKKHLSELEARLVKTEVKWLELLKQVPNIPLDDVPVGASEADNVVIREWGKKPKFDFKPKSHWQLAEARGLIDKKRAAKVAGARFAYLTGPLVPLQFAIIQWTLELLADTKVLQAIAKAAKLNVSAKPFTPVLPPYMLRTEVFDAVDRLEPRDDRYRVGDEKDDLWLQGSAEHVMAPMRMDEIIPEGELPVRYLGYATSFRREAGSYGKDLEGIIRLHQFDKLEMESLSTAKTGRDEHHFLIAIQEHLMQQLELPYRVLNKCTADIGKPNASGVDIEVWLPGHGKYLETHTADYMTDYQARRLSTRTKRDKGDIELVHTNDATAFALGRTMVAIIENYQQSDGTIIVPRVLQKYLARPVV